MLELFRIYGRIDLEGADKANKDLDKFEGKGKKATSGLMDFVRGTGKVAAGLGVFALARKAIDTVTQSIDGAIDRYDTLNNFPRVMQQLGFDAKESQGAIDKLSDGIQGLPTRLDEVASTAQGIAIMTGDLDGAVDTTLALNNAFLASGASTADAKRGLDQYVQMLSKGEVDLQSWRTLQETMPFALRETAEAFGFTGKSATNDFYEALKSGDVSMSEFNDKLIELDQAQGGFAETAKTASGGIKTAWTNMKTWVVTGVAGIIGAIDEALGGVGSIEGAINSLKPVFSSVFGFIADVIIKTGEVIRNIKDRFNDLKPALSTVKGAMEPLFAAFKQTGENLKGQLGPILDSLKGLFESLWPIIEKVAMIVGGALVTSFVIFTTILNGVLNAIGPLINALINLVDFVVNVVNTVIALLTGDFAGALEFWNAATEASVEFFKSLWDGIVGFVKGIVDAVIGWFETLYMVLVGNSIIPDMVEAIVEWFQNMFGWLIDIVANIVSGVVNLFKGLKNMVSAIFGLIKTVITTVWNTIKAVTTTVWNAIKAVLTTVWNVIKSIITTQINNIKTAVTTVWNAIKSVTTTVFNAIKSVVTTVWNGIKDAMTKPVDAAKDKIKSAIEAIKGFFSGLKLKLPKIEMPKLPKFTMTGKFSLTPPSVPKLGVSWNADGGIFAKPTIFNTANAGLQGVGEAGPEAILPLNAKTLAGIGKGIAEQMGQSEMVAIMMEQNKILMQLLQKDSNLYVNGKILGEITDEEQGKRIGLKGRRVAY